MTENKHINDFISEHLEKDKSRSGKYYTYLRNYPGYFEPWNNGLGPDENFMPTYKQDKNNPNCYIEKKDQCPSYTDRILMRNNSTC